MTTSLLSSSTALAQKRIRVFRSFLVPSPCRNLSTGNHKLPLPSLDFELRVSSHGILPVFSQFRNYSTSSPKGKSPEDARREIRRLDEQVKHLQKQRRLVGKTDNDVPYGRGRDSRNVSTKAGKNVTLRGKEASGDKMISRSRGMASYEGEDDELDEEDGELSEEDSDEDDDDDEDEIDEELGEDFSSDAEMYMESTDAENDAESEGSENEKETAEIQNVEVPQPDAGEAITESLDDVKANKHPWKEWNAFFDVLSQQNYFKDVPNLKTVVEGDGYLKFQSSAHVKHAILEFSRERDDIIRFLTKKHIRTVVNVGCPSTDRKVVNASKRLRVMCEIPEDEVCVQCKLKNFCTRAFAEPSPDLTAETSDVTRVLYSFALNASPIAESQVSYPIAVIKSTCHLLDEIVQLSAYPKNPALPASKARMPVSKAVREKDVVDSHDQNKRPGDWTCPDCNFLNFSKNRECRECGTFRESSKQLEPGDWECPECTFVNFRRNRECRECLTPRPRGADTSNDENMMPGDWKCPGCRFMNFAKNRECRRCSTRRPQGAGNNHDEPLEPGDWKCPECDFRNFRRNKQCRECGTLCPEQHQHDERWGTKKPATGSWGSSKTSESSLDGNRTKHEEWKPDLSRKTTDETDDDIEDGADVIFSRGDDIESDDVPRSSLKASTKGRGTKSRGSESEVDFSDLDDELPKKRKGTNKPKKGGWRDDDEEDDDNDMEDELSDLEDDSGDEEWSSSRSKKSHVGRKSSWNDFNSDDDANGDSYRRVKDSRGRGRGRGRGRSGGRGDRMSGSRYSRDSDDFSFSESDDDNGRGYRGARGGRGMRGHGGRGGGRISRGGNDFSFSESDDDGGFRSRRGGGRGRGRGRGGRIFSDSDDGGFRSRSGDDDGGFRNRRGGGRGRGGRSFSDSDDGGFRSRRGGGRGGGRGRGGGGRGRGGRRGGYS